MKGFPRRGSDRLLDGVPGGGGVVASMKGFPRRGSDVIANRREQISGAASMKGFPRRGSDRCRTLPQVRGSISPQ